MTPEQIQKIVDLLAEKLGPMAEVVWAAYVRQAYLSAIQDTIMGVATCVGFKCREARNKKLSGDRYAKADNEHTEMVASWVIAAIFLMIAGWILTVAPFRFLNLEYNAIHLLLKTVK
jgi:hypothetical protein